MTRIAIFCDGTWNSPSIAEPTNVHKLQSALINDPSQGQVSVYFPGIGTDDRFDGRVRKFFNKWGGGAFGWGLDAKVKQAYQFLAQAYSDGDEIYVFGFSRGAFTARSLVGMIRKCGIISDTSPESVNRAFALYRKRGDHNHPDKPHIRAVRRELSPQFATSDDDLEWRGDGSKLVNVAYIGVWDTVGARGIPPTLLGPVATLWNQQYKFHDMALSSLVKSARHALAINERRLFYRPAKWDNLDQSETGIGLNGGDTGDTRKYQQLWFIGNHSIVGGSASAQALSSYALAWVVSGAARLKIKPGITFPATPAMATGDADFKEKGLFKRWRKGPKQPWEIHHSAVERMAKRADYRPRCLSLFFPA
ncbi:MAG: DUF2235 domain-containing protein [Sulfitobacter sp.]